MWVLVNTQSVNIEKRFFISVGTGSQFELPESYSFIGSVIGHRGIYVWHIFEV